MRVVNLRLCRPCLRGDKSGGHSPGKGLGRGKPQRGQSRFIRCLCLGLKRFLALLCGIISLGKPFDGIRFGLDFLLADFIECFLYGLKLFGGLFSLPDGISMFFLLCTRAINDALLFFLNIQ